MTKQILRADMAMLPSIYREMYLAGMDPVKYAHEQLTKQILAKAPDVDPDTIRWSAHEGPYNCVVHQGEVTVDDAATRA